MANKTLQTKYNQVIDNIAYLIVNYPEALEKLLENHGIAFNGKLLQKDLSDAIIKKLESGDVKFQKALEYLILRLSATANEDQFLGGLIKGAVSVVGGLIKKNKGKRRSRSSRSSGSSNHRAAAQAAAAKRDLELRMERMRQERREREEKEERRRREEANRRTAEAKSKTNMMLMIGGGIAVLGIGAMVFMKSNNTPMTYPQMRPPTPPM